MIRILFVLVATTNMLVATQAQNQIRLMSYNLLNFPEPNPVGKEDTLAKILAYHPVDLLLVQEMRFQSGVDLILNNALNINGETRFSAATWVPMQSNPNSTHKLQQLLFYDHEKFILHDETYVLTERRDLNNYTLYLNDPDLANTQDTTWLDIYVVHLKSSQGTTNEQIRASMVDSLLHHMAGKPADRNVIVAGDFNVYTGSEIAFQNLIDSQNHIVLNDPINTVGNWHANPTYAGVHTQSTRISSIFSDGAGGGMDDRFDHVLLSSSLMNGTEGVSFSAGSFEALGNSGDCYDVSITSCSTVQTPEEVLWSLYYMSDHLPIVLDMETSVPIGIHETQVILEGTVFFNGPNALRVELRGATQEVYDLNVLDILGKELFSQQLVVNTENAEFNVQLPDGPAGIYLVTLEGVTVQRSFKVLRP